MDPRDALAVEWDRYRAYHVATTRAPNMMTRVVETYVQIEELQRRMADTRCAAKRYRPSRENVFDKDKRHA